MHGRRKRYIRKRLFRICRKLFLLFLNRIQVHRFARRAAVFHRQDGEPVTAELLILFAHLALALRRRLRKFR